MAIDVLVLCTNSGQIFLLQLQVVSFGSSFLCGPLFKTVFEFQSCCSNSLFLLEWHFKKQQKLISLRWWAKLPYGFICHVWSLICTPTIAIRNRTHSLYWIFLIIFCCRKQEWNHLNSLEILLEHPWRHVFKARKWLCKKDELGMSC